MRDAMSGVDGIRALSEKYKFHKDLVRRWICRYGFKRAISIIKALKSPCRRISIRVNLLKATIDDVLRYFEERENVNVIQHHKLEEVIFVLSEGPFKIPHSDKIVVADKMAAESVMMGANLFAPGVIKAEGVKRGDEVMVVDKYGQAVGYGIAEMDEFEMKRKRKGLAVRVTVSLYKVPSFRGSPIFEEGYVYPQSFPAIVTSRVLDPQPGELIVDMCAAPGGKTTHISQLMKNEGKIIAADRSKRKIDVLRENIRKMGVRNVQVLHEDARRLPVLFPSLKADRVLLDPPCTALGVRPKLFENRNEKDIKNSASYQQSLLRAAAKILRKGGVLVYSTCTLSPEENERNIEYAVNNLGFEVAEQEYFYGFFGEPFFPDYRRVQRFYPDSHDTPGFFIAKLVKVRD